MPGTMKVLLQVQQHAQAALLTGINSDHYGQVGLAKSTRAWAEKNVKSLRDRSIFSTWIDQGSLGNLAFV